LEPPLWTLSRVEKFRELQWTYDETMGGPEELRSSMK